MGLLAMSEMVQDSVIYFMLVQEYYLPRQHRVLNEEMRSRLKSKVYPPLTDSWAAFVSFALPVWAAAWVLPFFISLPVDNRYYTD